MTTLQWTDEIVRLGACDSGVAWARRRDFTPTPDQIDRGLSDSDWLVRRAWALRRAQNAPRIGEIDE